MNNVKRKTGFTIVEMLMVIGIIAVLLGLVSTAAISAIRNARNRKAEACRQVLQAGIATYRAQKDEWPGVINDFSTGKRQMSNGAKVYTLNDQEYDDAIRAVVKESVSSKNGTPMMDVTGLIVSSTGSTNRGIEFREAVKKGKKHGGSIKLANMVFGYQDSGGKFHRFQIQYNSESDHVTVK